MSWQTCRALTISPGFCLRAASSAQASSSPFSPSARCTPATDATVPRRSLVAAIASFICNWLTVTAANGPQRRLAMLRLRSYEPGDVVRFARDYESKGIAKLEALTVMRVDPAKNAVTLTKADGQSIDWRPRQWGATKSEAFMPNNIDLMKGDRIQFTRNDRAQSRENGAAAQVIALNPENRTARIRLSNGSFQTLDLGKSTDQHIRHGYAQTTHAAQGQTAERVMINTDSKATNLVDQKMLYVSISRAKTSASLYTNDPQKLITALKERTGEKQAAITPALNASKNVSAGLG